MSEEFATPAQSEDSAEIESAPASHPVDSSADSPAEESAGATVKVGLEILGRADSFVCRAGEEERLRAHAGELERRLVALGGKADDADATRFLIAAALQLADELYEAHREHEAEVRRLHSTHLQKSEQLRSEQEKQQSALLARHQEEAETRKQESDALRQRLEQLLATLSVETPPRQADS